MRLIMGIATCVLMFLPVASQADGLFSLNSTLYGREWDAVGRLEIAGEAFCTGALIAPDLVLTAAHCVFDPETGERVATDEIQFLAGWRNGRAAAYRRVRRAEPHPEYDFRAASDAGRVRVDIALLELQQGQFAVDEAGRRGDQGVGQLELRRARRGHDLADGLIGDGGQFGGRRFRHDVVLARANDSRNLRSHSGANRSPLSSRTLRARTRVTGAWA